MQIRKSLLREIFLNAPPNPPEIGGILGSSGQVIDVWHLDLGCSNGCGCFYTPNTCELNAVIQQWQSSQIRFRGIFHTHFYGVQTLSDGDLHYIAAIMQAMPAPVNRLYFPVLVLPDRIFIPYLAKRTGESVEINQEELVIV